MPSYCMDMDVIHDSVKDIWTNLGIIFSLKYCQLVTLKHFKVQYFSPGVTA